jgi:hypothetical protein
VNVALLGFGVGLFDEGLVLEQLHGFVVAHFVDEAVFLLSVPFKPSREWR